ncbi:phospholipase-like protein [Tanacetum coccineum]
MDLTGYEVPRVLITCRSRQVEVEGDGDENVPLYYDIIDNFRIQFGREEFCLITGLRFGDLDLADYNDREMPIPFRRRVFPSCYDGEHITGSTILEIIEDDVFDRIHDQDAVSLCCLGILQLVFLGVEAKRRIPDWMLRLANDRVGWDNFPWGSFVWPTLYSQLKNANVKRWPKLYASQDTTEIDKKAYSIFGYTWAFKTWILESFRVTATNYYYRYNLYPRVAAWKKKKGKFRGSMVYDFFHGNMPAKRLTPDETEARAKWWISSRAYFDGGIGQSERLPHGGCLVPLDDAIQEPDMINMYTHHNRLHVYVSRVELSPLVVAEQQQDATNITKKQGKPSCAKKKIEQRPSYYKQSPYMEQPPTTILPKQRGNKKKNNVTKANLSPLNFGNVFADENVGGDDVVFLGGRFTGNNLVYENVDPQCDENIILLSRNF